MVLKQSWNSYEALLSCETLQEVCSFLVVGLFSVFFFNMIGCFFSSIGHLSH